MATTTLIPLHTGKGRTVATALGQTTDYMKNPEKTDGGEWVSTYECDALTVDAEFAFSKNQYAAITGRDQGQHDVIAYHLRQAFKPGEIDPAMANKIGYELALSFTKGKYAFVCCTHVDKQHIHNHIAISSVSLDCTRKFRNFYNSSFAIRRISDQLCVMNGLSIVEEPKKSKGKNYGKWQGDGKPATGREKLCDIIDDNIIIGRTLTEFFSALKRAGVEIKNGKQLAFKLPGAKRFFRQDTLGDNYSADAIRERLSGARVVEKRNAAEGDAERKTAAYAASQNRPKLLIDIEEKLRQGYGGGFEQWATIENLKQKAKTLIFLKENGIGTYEELVKKESTVSAEYAKLSNEVNRIDTRLAEIKVLQKYIGQYSKTRDDWAAYKRSGWDSAFFEANRAELTLHKAAKNYFDEQGFKGKLPSISTLKQEYATLLTEKKSLGSVKAAREKMIDWATAKNTTDSILFGSPQRQKSHDRDAR